MSVLDSGGNPSAGTGFTIDRCSIGQVAAGTIVGTLVNIESGFVNDGTSAGPP